jgi:hypothetical protein
MTNEYTIIQVSAKIYWGFQMQVEKKKLLVTSIKDIIEELKETMKLFFNCHNLIELSEGVDNLNLYIHQYMTDPIIYVCDHNHDLE